MTKLATLAELLLLLMNVLNEEKDFSAVRVRVEMARGVEPQPPFILVPVNPPLMAI